MRLSENDAVIRLLAALTSGGQFRGNPYCSEEVKAVLVWIATERGYTGAYSWQDALEGLPAYEDYKRELYANSL